MEDTILYTLDTIKAYQKPLSVVLRRRVTGSNNRPTYQLLQPLAFELSNGDVILIPAGFEWDLSSVPRFLWGLLPPDGDFEIASLIHDFLYINNLELSYSRKFADQEMLLWSKAVSGTMNKISLRNFDNQVRYIAVRCFGWIVWQKLSWKIW